jgi:hypothetical protein
MNIYLFSTTAQTNTPDACTSQTASSSLIPVFDVVIAKVAFAGPADAAP